MATYPDAIVKNGVISDIETGIELPSYTGLVLADLAGRTAIMFTDLDSDGSRTWNLVHYGPTLSTTLINEFLQGRERKE